jgi:protoporphyrinogen/coproporphyrinogen III oxidase
METVKDLIVIGGGIAGLAAARSALLSARQAGSPLSLILIEAEPRWGGKILTDRVDGFVIEGGPDTFLATKPRGVGLCRELGLQERLHGTNPHQKSTYVMRSGRLEPLPEGLTMMIPSKFGPMIRTGLLSWPQKARMGLDFLLPPKSLNGDESLGAFVTRRLGRAAYEQLIEPLMSGIYAGDGDRLSLQSTFPYLRDMEQKNGGLIKGALAARRKMAAAAKSTGNPDGSKSPNGSSPRGGSRSIFLTPTTGLAEMVEALVEELENGGVDLRLGIPASRISFSGGFYQVELENGECLQAIALVLASPAFASAALLQDLDPDLALELQSIEYTSTATISLAYRQEDIPRPLDGYGYVIPRREGRRALACTWTSTKFPHRAPEGFVLLRVFAGRAGQEADIPWDEAGLLELAREEVRSTLGVGAVPILSRVFLWEKAMPQYNLGHPARLKRIEQCLQRWPGLTLAGNGYRGIGIPDCINSGETAAAHALEQVQRQAVNS